MALRRVPANKRFLWIDPNHLSEIYIQLGRYDPNDYVDILPAYSIAPVLSSAGNLSATYGNFVGSDNYNVNNVSLGIAYDKVSKYLVNKEAKVYKHIARCNVQDKRILYYYDDTKYQRNVITANMTSLVQVLSTYFVNKNLFKILDIYIDNTKTNDSTSLIGNIKIYYLEKK